MGRRLCLLVTTFVLVSAFAGGSAVASECSLSAPVPGGILLGFGEAYAASGRQLTHSGVDLGARVGDAIVAAASGQVTFAGAVPADGGGRVLAVTIQTPGGFKVTVSPLASVRVAAGEAVSAGDDLGMLSETGDASVIESHVHLSVRAGERYIDPVPMLTAAVVTDHGAGVGTGSAPEGETDSGASSAVASGLTDLGAAGSAVDGSVPAADALGSTSHRAAAGGVIDPVGSEAIDAAATQRQLASSRTTIGAAYCRAITHMRGSTVAPARPFVARSGRLARTSTPDVPSAPALPVGPMLGGAALIGTGGAVMTRIRRQYAGEVV